MVFRRPELAGLAAPALLLLGAGRATRGGLPGRLTVRVGLTSTRIYEGEPAAVDVVVSGADETAGAAGAAGAPRAGTAGAAGAASGARFDARWALEPGRGIEPGSATAVNGQAARFTFAIDRWGKRKLGTVTLTLHDRWRLAEGRVAFALPAIDCYPSPAVQRTEVVLSASCRTGWASTGPGCPATAPSSPASASTSPATGSGRSTGRPPPASAASR